MRVEERPASPQAKLFRFPSLSRFMRRWAPAAALSAAACGAYASPAQFVPLFDGKSLSGWVSRGAEGDNFTLRDGAIHIKGANGWLRTVETYDNFTLRASVRFLDTPQLANSGIFVRSADDLDFVSRWPGKSIEVEARDMARDLGLAPPWNGQVLRLGGSQGRAPDGLGTFRAKDSMKAFRPRDWNAFEVIVNGPRIWNFLNGVLVSSADNIGTGRGYIGFQAETGEIEWKDIAIRKHAGAVAGMRTLAPGELREVHGTELRPLATPPANDEIVLAKGTPILRAVKPYGDYTLELEYRTDDDAASADLVLRGSGQLAPNGVPADGVWVKLRSISTENRISGPPALVGDPRWPGAVGMHGDVLERASYRSGVLLSVQPKKGAWNKLSVEVSGDEARVRLNGKEIAQVGGLPNARGGAIMLRPENGSVKVRAIKVLDLFGE